MAWIRRTRVTLLVGLLLALATLAWLVAHPSIYSGQLGRIITDNLLRKSGAALTFESLDGNPLRNLTFHTVSLTRSSEDGSFVYLTADSLSIDYDLRSFFTPSPHLRSLVLGPAQLLVRRPAGDDPVREASGVRLFDASVQVDYARLDHLEVSVTESSGDQLDGWEDIQWVGSVRTGLDHSVQIHTARLAGRWGRRDLTLHRASFDAVIRGREVQVKTAAVRLDSTLVDFDLDLTRSVGGGVDRFVLEARAEAFSLNEILRLLGKDPGPRLSLQGKARLDYSNRVLRLGGAVEGWLGSYPLSARSFEASVDSTGLHLARAEGTFLSAVGEVRGDLDLQSGLLSLEGGFSGADLSDPWVPTGRRWPACRLGGRVKMELNARPPLRLDLELSRLRGDIVGLPVDSARTRLRFREGEGLEILSGRARILGTGFAITGSVDALDRAEMAITLEGSDSKPWQDRFDLPLRAEDYTAVARISGVVDSLALRVGGVAARLNGPSVRSEDNAFVVDLPRVADLSRARGQLRAGRSRIRGFDGGEVRIDFEREGDRLRVEPMQLSLSDSVLRWTGAVDWSRGTPTVELDSLEFRTSAQHWWLEEASRVDLFADGLRTEGLRLRSEAGRLQMVGSARIDANLSLRLGVEDGDLASLHRLGLLTTAASGHFDADLEFGGSLDRLLARVRVEVADAEVGGRSLGQGRFEARVEGREVFLDRVSVRGGLGGLEVAGRVTTPADDWPRTLVNTPQALGDLWKQSVLDLSVVTDTLATAPLLDPAAARRRFGLVSSDLQLRGTPLHPRLVGDLDIRRIETSALVVPRLRARIESDERGVHVGQGSLGVEKPWLEVAGYLPLDLSLAGAPHWNAADGLQLRIWSPSEVDLAPLMDFWPLARAVRGRGDFEFVAVGDPSAPQLSGTIELHDVELGLRGWSESLREGQLEAHFEGNRLVIDRLEAREGAKGRVQAHGEVIFRGLLPDDVWADFRLHRVLLASVPYLRAVGSSDGLRLRLARPSPDAPRAPHLTGTVQVDKAIYTGEFASGGGAEFFGPNLTPQWTADLAIHAREQVRISNQSAELRVLGDVDLIRDTAGLRFRGTAEIPRGQVPLFNNDFNILSGTLDFSRRPVEPEVDITAETEVPIYDPGEGGGRQLERITIHLTGTFAQPTVTFTSENGLDENSILRLLAGFGGPSESTTVSSGVSDVGLRAGLNFLERALAQRVRGVDTIDIETEEVGVSQMQSTRIAVGKYLSESLYLRLSQGLSITERDLFLEYQISRRLLFTSELRRRLRENGAENQFNVDMKFRVKY